MATKTVKQLNFSPPLFVVVGSGQDPVSEIWDQV
jgi:hypothetical protein